MSVPVRTPAFRTRAAPRAPHTIKGAGVALALSLPAAGLPLLRVDQRAAANLPQHYLVRQAADGSVTVTTNSADYLAAVSKVTSPAAGTALHDSTEATPTGSPASARASSSSTEPR